ncbi:MAG: hypothetical protein IPN22_04860 [Bacteroidetes bacterium]|nr:hypothetical protein [Bacteroidota bacterium]
MRKLLSAFLLAWLLGLQIYAHTKPCESCTNLVFRENKGQWEKQVLYKSEVKSGAVFFEPNQITFNLYDARDVQRIKGDHHKLEGFTPAIDYTLHFHAFRMKFAGAHPAPSVTGSETIPEYFNYFIGNDKSKWASAVRGFQSVHYAELYPGIALNVSSQNNSFKYVYEVKAGADASLIQVQFQGADKLNVNTQGDLLIQTSIGEIKDLKPYAFQNIRGKETEVACHYSLDGNVLRYNFPNGFDKTQPLFIDPTLIFSTYSGSTADNFGYSATYDSKGNAFGAGSVFGVGYPTTLGAYDVSYNGGPTITFSGGGTYPGDDISITKYSADGSQRLYSTYLGGFGQDLPHSLIANVNDELYVLGTTGAANFPYHPFGI